MVPRANRYPAAMNGVGRGMLTLAIMPARKDTMPRSFQTEPHSVGVSWSPDARLFTSTARRRAVSFCCLAPQRRLDCSMKSAGLAWRAVLGAHQGTL